MVEARGARDTVISLSTMAFSQRLSDRRRERGLPQQAKADLVGIHVTQLRRYESGPAQPALEVLKKLARALGTSIDLLAFDDGERGPSDDLLLQFEAASRLDPDERAVLKAVIDSILLKHDASRWTQTA